MRLSPDEMIFWKHGFINLNLTIVTTWALMLVLVSFSTGNKEIKNNHSYFTLAKYS